MSTETNTLTSNAAAATDIVNNNIALAMGAGLIPVPWVDFAAITAVQLKLGKELAAVYGVDYKEEQIKGVVVALIGAYTSTAAASTAGAALAKTLPGLGSVIGLVTLPLVAGAITYGVGKVFVQHLESGGNFLSLNTTPDVQAGFLREVEKGKEVVSAKTKNIGAKLTEFSDKLEARIDNALAPYTNR
jgi:uncharacterized protein (DUF697 family)